MTQLEMNHGGNQSWVGITNTPGHHPGIPGSLQGITLSDALTENQDVRTNFLKNKK
jgi:hypothetical protein